MTKRLFPDHVPVAVSRTLRIGVGRSAVGSTLLGRALGEKWPKIFRNEDLAVEQGNKVLGKTVGFPDD